MAARAAGRLADVARLIRPPLGRGTVIAAFTIYLLQSR